MKILSRIVTGLLFSLVLPACGGTGVGNPVTGNLTIQSNPLAGPSQGKVSPMQWLRPSHWFLMPLQSVPAVASVSSFSVFKACNDKMKFTDSSGNTISINGQSSAEVGSGLLNFSPTSTSPMTIGTVSVPSGVVIKEVEVTFAVVPAVCQGANYAVQFNDGVNGVKEITQNTAFKFTFSGAGLSVDGSVQSITLLFGQIVNGMVALGSGLNNSTIQTVNVGQAQ